MVKVAFLHPDMGIGGAEQLVVNLALVCKENNWDVKIITPYYDKNRAFQQTKDGTLDVEVHGNWFPRRICGRCQALCEYIRIFIASLWLIFFGGGFDLVVVDQIPISLPLLKLRYKTFFYCHFPDKLLCVNRSGIFKKIYRFFIDLTEEICIMFASIIVVNSKFTLSIYKQHFKLLSKFCKEPGVVYPCSDLKYFDSFEIVKKDLLNVKGLEKLKEIESKEKERFNNLKVVVSLNRYERKKNLNLAAEAYISFMKTTKLNTKEFILVIAGGYDERLQENIDVYNELIKYDYGSFKDNVFFLRSISNEERSIILKNADLVLYTPKNEHFGIVPCESMYCGASVIAHKSGGPTETINDEVGTLIDNENPTDWGKSIDKYFSGKVISKSSLKEYVLNNFSLSRMNRDFVGSLQKRYGNRVFKDNKVVIDKKLS